MFIRRVQIFCALLILSSSSLAQEQQPNTTAERINIGLQVTFGAVPYYIAQTKGYFQELGIETKTIIYPSGATQIAAAVKEQAWDFGLAGSVQNILGGAQGMLTIGVGIDQSAINQVIAANTEAAEQWSTLSTLVETGNVTIASTANSTGDFIVQACLEENKIDMTKVEWIYAEPAMVVAALLPSDVNGTVMPPKAMYGGLWSPNTNRFLEKVNNSESLVLCTGEQVYKTITGGLTVRQAFFAEKPVLVQRVMAAWLRGIAFVKNESNREEVLSHIQDFFVQNNVTLSRASMEKDLKLIGFYNLTQQMEFMVRRGDPPSSDYDFSIVEMSEFLLKNGVVTTYPPPIDYITNEVFEAIDKDPFLKAFANGENVKSDDNGKKETKSSTLEQWSWGLLPLATIVWQVAIM